MAEKLEIPNQVIDSDWKDDIDYEAFDHEREYIPPSEVSRESIAKIKSRNTKIGQRALFALSRGSS